MLAGLDTSVLTDVRLLGIEMVLGRTLTGRGCTTGFVDRGFHDPTRGSDAASQQLFRSSMWTQ
jgi:hypothetical protein